MAKFEEWCASVQASPGTIEDAFAVMDGKPTRAERRIAELEAKNERLRDGIAGAMCCRHPREPLDVWVRRMHEQLRALLSGDGGGEDE